MLVMFCTAQVESTTTVLINKYVTDWTIQPTCQQHSAVLFNTTLTGLISKQCQQCGLKFNLVKPIQHFPLLNFVVILI